MYFHSSLRKLVLLLTIAVVASSSGVVEAADSMAAPLIDLEHQDRDSQVEGKSTGPLIRQTVSMDAELVPIATTIGITEYVNRLPQLRKHLDSFGAQDSLEKLTARQDLCEAQEQMMRRVFKANMEVDYMLARIDAESNNTSQLLIDLTSKRDKDVMLSSILSQLTNAALWSLSCTYTVASTYHPSYSYADGIIGITAGIIPSAFSLYALYQLQGPKRNLKAEPNILEPMFASALSVDVDYPGVVKTYLAERPAGHTTGPSRKERMLELWRDKGYLANSKKPHLFQENENILAGTIAKRAALTIKMLQTRQLMLTDLRCEVIQLKKQFLGLTKIADAN